MTDIPQIDIFRHPDSGLVSVYRELKLLGIIYPSLRGAHRYKARATAPLNNRIPDAFFATEAEAIAYLSVGCPTIGGIMQNAAALADSLDLTLTQFNSGTERHEASGFRVFRKPAGKDHFDAGWLFHARTPKELMLYLEGYAAGRSA